MPTLDKQFLEKQFKDPTGAVGRAGPLKRLNENRLAFDGARVAYANNDIGVHRVENRSPHKPAFTMHIYAPGLKKIKIFKECGGVSVLTVGQFSSNPGEWWRGEANVDGVLDVARWNMGLAGVEA